MRIAIVGTGYVGLVSGACFADFGHDVTCIDNNEAKITAMSRGEMPVFEPGLADVVGVNLKAKQLTFTTDLKGSVPAADIVFIAVGTPSRRSDGHVDLSAVYGAAREVANALKGFTVIAIKSTVPVGTGDEVERLIRAVKPNADIAVVSNPEFLREGSAISDFRLPNRIVVGMDGERARELMAEVYRPLSINQGPLLFTDRRTSELIKYAANAFLAMKVTFINEIADLCENVGADVQDVARGIGLDNRIGTKFMHAGPGFGGSCFPKDTLALTKIAHDHGVALRLVETTVAVNEHRKRDMARRVIAACGGTVRDKKIAILGLTFKPNTDDMREAPSLAIIQGLQDAGAQIKAYDPAGMKAAQRLTDDVEFSEDVYDAATGVDAVVIVTEWPAFRALDLARLKAVMARPVLVDLRNIYARSEAARHGFHYVGVGKAPAPALDVVASAAE